LERRDLDTQAWITDRQIPNDITIALSQPIHRLHWLEQSLLMAEFSRLAYFSQDVIQDIADKAGVTLTEFVDREGAQAYLFASQHDLIVVARGTEPNQWDDIRADANAWTVIIDIGRVHRGFKGEVDHLWPLIEKRILSNRRPTYFTGHSLGGAMAQVCAVRCKQSAIFTNPYAVFTYGSPRVGNRKFIRSSKLSHYRWVNNNDIVTRVPPRWLGYSHSGIELYLDHRGRLRKVYSLSRSKDRFIGLLKSLRKWKLDYLADHSMVDYILNIRGLVQSWRGGKAFPDPKMEFPELPQCEEAGADLPRELT
jgi:triacylglycerol lipase